jgi:hypothetical protein
VQLKTSNGQVIDPNDISCILTVRITGGKGTLVQLKTNEEVYLENLEEEVVDEMNRFDMKAR